MRFIAGLLVAAAMTFGIAPVASADEGRLAPEVRQVQPSDHDVNHLKVVDFDRNGDRLRWELNDGSVWVGTRECRSHPWVITRCRKAWKMASWGHRHPWGNH